MGAATSVLPDAGGYTGWFTSGAGDVRDVVMVLNDARNIVLLDREELSGLIHLNAADSGKYVLSRESPASLSLTSTNIVEVELQGLIPGQETSPRCLGEVTLPLHYISRQCGGNLYQIWLPLRPVSALSKEEDHIEQFEKAMLKAARDPRKPMVCISIYAGSIPQASKNYLFDASQQEKAKRFLGLQMSHSQHLRMMQALYRVVRMSQAQSSQQLDSSSRSKDGLADSWPEPLQRLASGSPVGFADFSPEAEASPVEDQRAALLEEIKETRTEADERIQKAEKTIQALKEMINDKQVELIQRRKEVSRLRHESESLQLENEKLELQLSRSSLQGPNAADAVEAANLRRQAQDLSTHKEALQLILRDFYRAMGQESPSLMAIVSKHAARQRKVIEPDQVEARMPSSSAEVQEWTNMLPRPSELLLSGLDERFAHEM